MQIYLVTHLVGYSSTKDFHGQMLQREVPAVQQGDVETKDEQVLFPL